MSWSEFLTYAAGPGVNVIVGALLSVVVEYWPAYDALEPKWKRLGMAGLCLLVPFLATVAAVATGEFGAWGDWATTWWPVLLSAFAAFTGATVAHIRKLA